VAAALTDFAGWTAHDAGRDGQQTDISLVRFRSPRRVATPSWRPTSSPVGVTSRSSEANSSRPSRWPAPAKRCSVVGGRAQSSRPACTP
jgi:hypothetical protein